jgi:excinuclease ABC subunit B
VADIMEGASTIPGRKATRGAKKVAAQAENTQFDPSTMTAKQLAKAMSQLEDKMYEASKNLEFELAGHYRDELQRLKHSA